MTTTDAQILVDFEAGWCDGIEAAFEGRAEPLPAPPHDDYQRGFVAGVAAYTQAMAAERARLQQAALDQAYRQDPPAELVDLILWELSGETCRCPRCRVARPIGNYAHPLAVAAVEDQPLAAADRERVAAAWRWCRDYRCACADSGSSPPVE